MRCDTSRDSFVCLASHKRERSLCIFNVTLAEDDEGWIVAQCPALPGCVSQGRSQEEALENIREAIAGWLLVADQRAVSEMNREQAQFMVAV